MLHSRVTIISRTSHKGETNKSVRLHYYNFKNNKGLFLISVLPKLVNSHFCLTNISKSGKWFCCFVQIIRADKNVPQYNTLILVEIIPQECIFNAFLYIHSIVLQPQNES